MAIDADWNAGVQMMKQKNVARKFHVKQIFMGMDGASKFVKGDAVAGILILAINIIGGLILA